MYFDVPANDYHHLRALSASGLKTLITECPAVYRYEQDNPEEDEPSNVKLIGSAAHVINLEPHLWAQKVVIIEAADWRTKDAKAQRDAALTEGLTPLLKSQVDTVLAMNKRFKVEVGDQLQGGRSEVTYLWQERRCGVRMKARPDWRADDARLLVDYKTTGSVHPDAVRARVFDNWHHVQAGLYIEAHETLFSVTPDWLWIAQATKPPYLVTIARPTNATLHIAMERADEAIRTYAECERTGVWPSYSQGVVLIEPPARALYQHSDWTEQRQARQQAAKARAANDDKVRRHRDEMIAWQAPHTTAIGA